MTLFDMVTNRFTICKGVAESLQAEGWRLVETFFSVEYQSEVYHLEKQDDEGEEQRPDEASTTK